MPRNNNTMILVSGGIDSVAALVKVLKDTDDFVHVHHLNLKNYENRDVAESEAMGKIIKYCRENYRDFKYTESDLCLGEWVKQWAPLDIYVYMWYAGIAAMRYSFGKNHLNKVVTGTIDPSTPRVRKAFEIFNSTSRSTSDYTRSSPTDTLHRQVAIKRTKERITESGIKWDMPVQGMTKEQIWQSMPLELAKMCWSCRKPVIARDGKRERCGECKTCIQMKNINKKYNL